MGGPTVFIYTPVDESGQSHRRLEEAGCELKIGSGFWKDFAAEDRNITEELDDNIHALMSVANRRMPVTREALQAAKNLRIISKYTIGVDDIDVAAATELGILITHCPTEANWGGVAESAMTMMLDLLKKSRERDRHVKEGGWRHESLEGTYLGARHDGYAGITVGIVGLGRIGTRLADLPLYPQHRDVPCGSSPLILMWIWLSLLTPGLRGSIWRHFCANRMSSPSIAT